MIEIRGDKKVLITPVSAEDLKDIHIGDIVWLDGDLMTLHTADSLSTEESFHIISKTRQFSMPARSYGKLREQKMITRWFLSDRLLPCVWRNSSMNLQN